MECSQLNKYYQKYKAVSTKDKKFQKKNALKSCIVWRIRWTNKILHILMFYCDNTVVLNHLDEVKLFH